MPVCLCVFFFPLPFSALTPARLSACLCACLAHSKFAPESETILRPHITEFSHKLSSIHSLRASCTCSDTVCFFFHNSSPLRRSRFTLHLTTCSALSQMTLLLTIQNTSLATKWLILEHSPLTGLSFVKFLDLARLTLLLLNPIWIKTLGMAKS